MKKFVLILLSVLLVLSVAACGSGGSDNGGETTTTAAAETTTTAGGEERTGRVGVSMPTQSSERWIRDGEGIKAGLEALGYEVDLQFAEDSVDAQLSQIENMLTTGIDALVVASIDGSALSGVAAKAKEQGAVVISYDRLLTNTPDVDYYATFDSISIGRMQGGYIVEKLGLPEGKGPFNVEIFAGSLDDNNAPLYYDGAMMELQEYIDSGMVVIKSGQTDLNQVATQNWDGQIAQARMDNILSAYYSDGTRVDGVVSPYDGLSIGILASLKAVGYGSDDLPFPIISGQDAELPSVKSIIAGEQAQTVFVDTRELAKVAVKMVDQWIKGEEVEVNKPGAYDNGSKKVDAMAIPATSVDIDNYYEVLVGSGYYTEDDLK